MNRRRIAAGPGASSLILIAVVLALSVLAMLTMISARSDESLTMREAETRQEVYVLFSAGEHSLAKLDGVLAASRKDAENNMEGYLAAIRTALPEGMTMEGDQVRWTERTENRTLDCAVRILPPDSPERIRWTEHRLGAGNRWEADGDADPAPDESLPEEDAEEDAEDDDGSFDFLSDAEDDDGSFDFQSDEEETVPEGGEGK